MAHITAEFDQLIEEMMNEWHVPGLAVAVINGDEIHSKVVPAIPIFFVFTQMPRAMASPGFQIRRLLLILYLIALALLSPSLQPLSQHL